MRVLACGFTFLAATIEVLLLVHALASDLASDGDYARVLRLWAELLPSIEPFIQLDTHAGNPSMTLLQLLKPLSGVFKEEKYPLGLLLIGACDGTQDDVISECFIPNAHWHGLFVEPVTFNVDHLQLHLQRQRAESRAHIVRGAVLDHCEDVSVDIKRPIFEETNKSEPHWKRRQIGQVLNITGGEVAPRPSKFWRVETVRCLTPSQLLVMWRSQYASAPQQHRQAFRRFHVIKIDAEGTDYRILEGILTLKRSQLPLVLYFEAKIMGSALFADLKARLRSRGFRVSCFHNDAVAVLEPDRIFKNHSP